MRPGIALTRGFALLPDVRTREFDYDLPAELIAQFPAAQRDQSRLMVLNRSQSFWAHQQFNDLPTHFRPGDVLVLNNSKVIPARLRGLNSRSHGEFEVLLLEENAVNDWWAMVRPGKRARANTRILFKNRNGQLTNVEAQVTDQNTAGHRRLQFSGVANIGEALSLLGEVPLPPYIRRAADADLSSDLERYQTVYAQADGSVAAPTAGLHFTRPLLDQLRGLEVEVCFVTLHVGYGTFAPVKAENLSAHVMHEERYYIGEKTAQSINAAKRNGQRIIAVGTTCVRVLESVAAENQARLVAGQGRTRIFIHPPFRFQVVDALLTNFHLPRSTLLMLVSSFASPGEQGGRAWVLAAYAEAVRQRYRFFSYGDAMLLV